MWSGAGTEADVVGGTYDEAECEEGTALGDVGGHVSAVVALAHHAFVAGDLAAEGVLPAHEEEEHCCCSVCDGDAWGGSGALEEIVGARGRGSCDGGGPASWRLEKNENGNWWRSRERST